MPWPRSGLLLLRLSVGVLMIHHGQEKLADPHQFANTYVASLHLPFPLFFAYAAGFSELIGSWLVIFGLFTPFGSVALSGTMMVAAYQHISTAGLNIDVLELVLLYLGGSLALLCNGPGRFSFDAGTIPALLEGLTAAADADPEPATPAAPLLATAIGLRGQDPMSTPSPTGLASGLTSQPRDAQNALPHYSGQHQQQQAVALWIQKPGLGAERLLFRRIVSTGAELQGRADPGVEQRKGIFCLRLALQAEGEATPPAQLRPAP